MVQKQLARGPAKQMDLKRKKIIFCKLYNFFVFLALLKRTVSINWF